jgi:hypothetical protein
MNTTLTTKTERRGAGHQPAPVRPRTDVTLLGEVRDLLIALYEFATRPSRRIHDLVNVYRRRAYYLAYTVIGLGAMLGPVSYYAFWGHNYFNGWFLFLGPALTFLTFVVSLACFHLGVYFLWGQPGFFARKVAYLKHMYVWLAYTPLAWLVYPLRAIWPGFENPAFWVSFPLVFYFLWRVTRRGERVFRKRELAAGIMASGVPYFVILLFHPELARFIVRLLEL